ncbi:MAG TPA: long-chain-fatty-acid--CoA ligase [bacterium]|nr:long-chain-fatty-acid--CoA ligase [bacterium]
MKRTIKDLLIERTEKHADKTFLFWEDEEIKYSRLLDTARRVSSSLMLRGLEKDDKVCIWAMNRPEFIYMMLGCAFSGTVLTPINTQFKADEAQYILQNSQAKVLVTQPSFAEMVEKIRPSCPDLKEVIMLDEAPGDTVPFNDLYEPKKIVDREIGEEDIAGIIYTSGTTGYPKGVLLTHHNYHFNAWEIVDAAQMTEADRFLCILPLFHVNGQLVTVYSPLFAGGSMILLKGFSPKDFLPKLERYQATAFSGVPTVYAILNNLPDAGQYDLSKLRFCICGAAPMPVEVFETFERKYKAFILEGYGLSEGTCASSINPLDAPRKIGSIGLPFKGQELKIFDDKDQEVPRGEVGEIVVRGENVMQGYYRNPEATAATLKGAWLHTGDLGHQDQDGYFFIVGRKKEMIIRGGENIYPKEIEEVLYKHPAVLDAAVVGLPDKIWGEEVAAFIVPKQGQEIKDTDVIEYCKGRLANYKCPRMVFTWAELPKTATGKIQKNRIVEKYLKQKGQ